MTENSTLTDQARLLAAYTEAVADRLRWLAEDWAEYQKWATKAAEDAEKAEKAARSHWDRKEKSEMLFSLVYTAAEGIVSGSQDWESQAKEWTSAQNVTQMARLVAQQAKRSRG